MNAFITGICAFALFSINLLGQTPDPRKTEFKKADSMAALYPHHSLQDLKLLSSKLTADLPTEEEKFRAIYKWICNNIETDYVLHLKNTRRRSRLKSPEDRKRWNDQVSETSFNNLVNHYKTVCTGYAFLLQRLASYAGLSCVIVNGYGRNITANIGGSGTPNHSWNSVRLYNRWYLCDPTWSSGSYDPSNNQFVKQFTACYFLADEALFIMNHYPQDSSWMFLTNKPTLNEFLNRPLIYTDSFNLEIQPILPETFEVTALKGQAVSFRFTYKGDPALTKVDMKIDDRTLHGIVWQLADGGSVRCAVDYAFDSRGTYDVHFLADEGYVITYHVTVK